jgi:hypothetical protein
MRPRWYVATLLLVAACTESAPTPTGPANGPSLNLGQGVGGPEPHVFLPRGQARLLAAGSSPLMTYHGGDIIQTSKTMAIFWGPAWSTSAGDKITGMDAFFGGYSGTVYNQTVTEYTGLNSDQVQAVSTYLGHWVDAASSPPRRPQTSQVLAEACSALTAAGKTPDASALYVVYSSGKRGGAQYCAYHTWGSCNGTPIQAAWVFNLDGDSGCNPGTPYGATGTTAHSQGLAAIANVTAHELSETITDPTGSTWYDASGAENGDKCAWTFGPTGSSLLSTFTSTNSTWKLQGEWSNAAYSGTYTGPSKVYPNSSGQNGCLAGF